MHPSTKFVGNIFIQSGDINIFFRNSIWRPPPSLIFVISEFRTFPHDDCRFLELSSVSNLVQTSRTNAENDPNLFPTFDCELTSGPVFVHLGIYAWLCCICGYQILWKYIQYEDISMLGNSKWLSLLICSGKSCMGPPWWWLFRVKISSWSAY